MKTGVVKHIIKQVFCWILLLQIINISIHPTHFTHRKSNIVATSKDVPIKEIDSFYELIAEGVFDQDVPESEEDEIDVSSPAFDLYFSAGTSATPPPGIFAIKHFSRNHMDTPLVHKEPHSPPPRNRS